MPCRRNTNVKSPAEMGMPADSGAAGGRAMAFDKLDAYIETAAS